jgi:phosphonopyruvate decarboxylase
MIATDDFVAALDERGYDFFSGVPCSYLSGPIAALTEAQRYVPAVNEGAALAMAAGAASTGRRAAVLLQNSGFGNLINPLTSLLLPYRLPVLMMMTLRGWPDPDRDEPQHRTMGMTTHALLDVLGIRHWTLTGDGDDVNKILTQVDEEAAEGRPAMLLIAKHAISDRLPAPSADAGPLVSGAEAIAAALTAFPDALIVSTTGFASRQLFAQCDSARCFYMQGSMGHASALALGIALSQPQRKVLLVDGDGAALMHLGSMATIATVQPPNLVHLVLDNGAYESTGGQPTTVGDVDFAATAAALGYRHAGIGRNRAEITEVLLDAAGREGPAMVQIKTASGVGNPPPRATTALSAADIRARFAAGLARTPQDVT